MYKTIEEVQAALATRLPEDQLKDVNGYSYVPWEVTTRQLTDIFGPFGWEELITNQQYDTAKGIYIVSRRLTGYATMTQQTPDGESYERHVSISREGVGVGIANDQSGRANDTAIKGADSDSFSRAAKKLGDAFGLYLYDRNDPARQQNHSAPARPPVQGTVTGTTSDGRNLSDKQVGFLRSLGWTNVGDLTLARAKSIMENRERATAPAQEAVGALPF